MVPLLSLKVIAYEKSIVWIKRQSDLVKLQLEAKIFSKLSIILICLSLLLSHDCLEVKLQHEDECHVKTLDFYFLIWLLGLMNHLSLGLCLPLIHPYCLGPFH